MDVAMTAIEIPAATAARPSQRPANTLLYLDGVTVSFDGFRALNQLSLVIEKGELRTVIGPNGGGKTTMVEVITGKTRPDTGVVFYDGDTDLTRLDEAAIANLGIGRKFQKPTVFENLRVFENLELALKSARGTWQTLLARLSSSDHDRVMAVLETVGMIDREDALAGAVSHGQKQWLEIGLLLIHHPKLLLLEEPRGGTTDHETDATAGLILELAGNRTMFVVERE